MAGSKTKKSSAQQSNKNPHPLAYLSSVLAVVAVLAFIIFNLREIGAFSPARYSQTQNSLAEENLPIIVAVASASPVVSAPVPQVKAADKTPGPRATGSQTAWGEKISSNTYVVRAGDKLSKIAGRAYGDPKLYLKIMQANKISNPNQINVGMVLKIPR